MFKIFPALVKMKKTIRVTNEVLWVRGPPIWGHTAMAKDQAKGQGQIFLIRVKFGTLNFTWHPEINSCSLFWGATWHVIGKLLFTKTSTSRHVSQKEHYCATTQPIWDYVCILQTLNWSCHGATSMSTTKDSAEICRGRLSSWNLNLLHQDIRKTLKEARTIIALKVCQHGPPYYVSTLPPCTVPTWFSMVFLWDFPWIFQVSRGWPNRRRMGYSKLRSNSWGCTLGNFACRPESQAAGSSKHANKPSKTRENMRT